MVDEIKRIKSKILFVIEKVAPDVNQGALGEQLDSLHRLFVIEQLESEFQKEFHAVLFDRNAWKNIDALSQRVYEEIQ